jgi:hypothetical protein
MSEALRRHKRVFTALDRWRIALALMVVALHAEQLGFLPFGTGGALQRMAHDAVIGFFVISGYSVMQSGADHRGNPTAFLVARFSRLYSLVVPALLITLCLDLIGKTLRPDLYPLWVYRKWWLHLGFHGLFLGETWTNSFAAFSNIPYWSLGYEAWFYLLLAATLGTTRYRPLQIGLVLLLMGPRVLLLAPCWALGAWAWQRVDANRLHSGVTSWPAWLSPAAVLLGIYGLWFISPFYEWLHQAGQGLSGAIVQATDVSMRLSNSRFFLSDWVIAAGFTVMILTIAASDAQSSPPSPLWVRSLAFHSFGIYLFHYPILLLAAACGLSARGRFVDTLCILATVAICVGLSALFSPTRTVWQSLLTGRARF